MLNGLDDIGLTMQKGDKIGAFEAQTSAVRPWI
jgi:3-isopropylmalate/(R)-2-methylmalate dehydratase small subunit